MKPVKVDTKIWRGLVKEFKEKAAEIEERLGFNVFSHKTVLSRLADLGFHLQNTAAETLEEYRTQHPIFDEIITCRSYRTAVSRYGMNWLDNYLEDGDLMYASWKVTGAETGRMACSKPPLQQVPVRNEELGMDRYRTAFISAHPKGSMLVSDVSMQEPRITAYASQDENLLAAAKSGEDIHQYVTDQLSGALKKKVSRKLGKDVNLGMVYGLSPYGLARNVGISEDEARELMGIYFNRFPGVVSWAAWTKNRALSKGFVDAAKRHAGRVLDALDQIDPPREAPIVGIEPPEIYSLKHDYLDLVPEREEEIARRVEQVWLLDEFLLRSEQFNNLHVAILGGSSDRKDNFSRKIKFHPHCHQRAEGLAADGLPIGTNATVELLRSCGYDVELLDTGCCGMAGTFGYEAEHYELSMKVGELKLFPALRTPSQPPPNPQVHVKVSRENFQADLGEVPLRSGAEGVIVSTGAACRMQIRQGTGINPIHPVVLIANFIKEHTNQKDLQGPHHPAQRRARGV